MQHAKSAQEAGSYPLEDVHREFLIGICHSCNQTQQVINRAMAAGIPVQPYHETNQAQLNAAKELVKQFFGFDPTVL